jgi:hypothetical protein
MRKEIAQHLDRANELLVVARENFDNGHFADSVSRSYYAAFHAATGLLLALDVERGSHHALWSAFGEHVSAPGVLDKKYHRYALDLFYQRSQADYLALPESTPGDATAAITKATEFVAACRTFLENRPKGA